MTGKGTIHTRGVNLAAGLLPKVLVAANVVCVRMGVENGPQRPSLLFQQLAEFPTGVFVVSAVDEVDLVFLCQIDSDFDGSVNIVTARSYLDKFIHSGASFLLRMSPSYQIFLGMSRSAKTFVGRHARFFVSLLA